MTSLDPIVDVLRSHAAELRARGVAHAAVFGSVARREDREGSDVDILVELEPDVGILAFTELRLDLSELLGRRVDLVTAGGLRPFARVSADRDVVRVF